MTTSDDQAQEVFDEVFKQIEHHPRKEICNQSIKNWGLIAICENLESCVELSNEFAPEHLEIITIDPKRRLNLLRMQVRYF